MNLVLISFLLFPHFSFAGVDSQLLKAASEGNFAKVKSLVEEGADVNARGNAGETALIKIASAGRSAMPQLWNDTGFINPDFQFPHFRKLALKTPDERNAGVGIARFLIDKGADVNLKNDYGRTALMVAAKYGQADLVGLLLRHGASVRARDSDGRTALDYAYQSEHQQVASLIQDYRLHPPKKSRDAREAERLSHRWTLSRREVTQIAARAASQAQNPAQKKIARRLKILSKEIANLKKESEKSPHKSIVSDVDYPTYHVALKPEDFAVVVGVEKYAGSLPFSAFSKRDAEAVKRHLIALGVPPRHIRFLINSQATRSDLSAYLEEWLPKNVKPKSRIFFYFSGHGAPDPDTQEAYLVPFDGNPEFLGKTAYPLTRLYSDFAKLSARRVVVVLDSCFSGLGARSVVRSGVRPLTTRVKEGAVPGGGKIIVFTAARDNQTAGVLNAQGHGLLTYYFLRGLNGKALNQTHEVTAGSLYHYLKSSVENEANLDNNTQDPQLLPRSALTKIYPIVLRERSPHKK